jgi:hypothetical protein
MSFFEKLEIWKEEYLFLKYAFLNFKDYKNLGFNLPIGLILIFLAIAFPIMVFFINNKKNTTCFAMKQLVRHEAFSEESAKNLTTLRLFNNKLFKKMLLSGGQIASIIKIVGYEKPSYEEYLKAKKEKKKLSKINFSEIKIFISEEKKEEAETIAEAEITPIWKPIVISVAGIAILALLFIFMPEILTLLNSSI